MFYYRIFGLLIALPWQHPSWPEVVKPGTIDIQVSLGQVPDYDLSPRSPLQQVADGVVLHVAPVADYWVCGGKAVVIDVVDDADWDEVALFLFGSVMGIVLYQRGYLLLHANAIAMDDETCVAFAGPSGIGKSTLAYACVQQGGYHLLSDDVTAIQFDDDGQPWVVPAYPQVKLWEDMADFYQAPNASRTAIAKRWNKFNVALPEAYCQSPRRLTQLFCLQKQDQDAVSCTPIQGIAKFEAIRENSYRYEYLQILGFLPTHFQQCQQLLQVINVLQVVRSEQGHYSHDITEWLKLWVNSDIS